MAPGQDRDRHRREVQDVVLLIVVWIPRLGSSSAHTQFPGGIQGAGGRGVMYPSNVYNVRNAVCMTAYYAGQCSACGLLCWLGWVYLGVGWPGHTYWHMCSGYVNVDITGQMEVSKHHL